MKSRTRNERIQTHQPDWQVLLIGGNSGAGKTIVAQQLAHQFGVALGQVDNFRLVLQRVTTPAQQPILHSLLTWEDVADLSPEGICNRLIEICQVMSHALEIVVAHHVATDMPMILEGDGIVPSVAAQQNFADLPVANKVRSVFIIESDEEWLIANTRQRQRGNFARLPIVEQTRRVQVNLLYGRRLKAQAAQYTLPVVDSRPWDSLARRINAALGSL